MNTMAITASDLLQGTGVLMLIMAVIALVWAIRIGVQLQGEINQRKGDKKITGNSHPRNIGGRSNFPPVSSGRTKPMCTTFSWHGGQATGASLAMRRCR